MANTSPNVSDHNARMVNVNVNLWKLDDVPYDAYPVLIANQDIPPYTEILVKYVHRNSESRTHGHLFR
jgi:hypothetical protein